MESLLADAENLHLTTEFIYKMNIQLARLKNEISFRRQQEEEARLEAEGTIKTFDLKFPCPMDQQCLSRIGLDAKTFQTLAVQNRNDETLIPALREAGAKLG